LFFLSWVTIQFPQEKSPNLMSVKKYLPESFQDDMNNLYKKLYGPESDWNGESLWHAFQTFKPPAHDQISSIIPLENLDGLYSTGMN